MEELLLLEVGLALLVAVEAIVELPSTQVQYHQPHLGCSDHSQCNYRILSTLLILEFLEFSCAAA